MGIQIEAMAITEAQLSREIADLEDKTTALATELYELWGQYLDILGPIAQRQLVSASFHLCTQMFPDSFLRLSYGQRVKLQRSLRQLGEQLRLDLQLDSLQQRLRDPDAPSPGSDPQSADAGLAESLDPDRSTAPANAVDADPIAAATPAGNADLDSGSAPASPMPPSSLTPTEAGDGAEKSEESEKSEKSEGTIAPALTPTSDLGLEMEQELERELAAEDGLMAESHDSTAAPPHPNGERENDLPHPKQRHPNGERGDNLPRSTSASPGEDSLELEEFIAQLANAQVKDETGSPVSIPPELSMLLAAHAAALLRRDSTRPPMPCHPTSLRNPQFLLDWSETLEQTLDPVLRSASQQATQILSDYRILQHPVPEALLNLAAESDQAPQSAGSPGHPHLVSFRVEMGQIDLGKLDAGQGDLEKHHERKTLGRIQVVAVYLQHSDLEFGDLTLAPWRTKIRRLHQQIHPLNQRYQRRQRDVAVIQAESAWRSSWSND